MRSLVAGAVSALFFLICWFALALPIVGAVVAAIGCFVGLSLVLGGDTSAADRLPAVAGLTKEQAYRAISEGRQKVTQIRQLGAGVADPRFKAKITAIAETADLIFADFEKDPKDIKAARNFLNQYLDATVLVVGRYSDLSGRGATSADVQKVLAQFGELLDTIHVTFQKQHDHLLADDALDLDTEMTVLKKMMELEGL